MHESFEWNCSADISTLFPADQANTSLPVQHSALIVALVDNKRTDPHSSRRRHCIHQLEGAVGFLELSREDLESSGTAGRWFPLRAYSSTPKQWHRDVNNVGSRLTGNLVGEALIATAWLQGPAARVLPGVENESFFFNGQRQTTKKSRLKLKLAQEKNTKKGGDEDNTDVNLIQGQLVENSTAPMQERYRLHIHVWDGLLSLCPLDSALYLTIRIYSRGFPGQRVSTKPAHARGGVSSANVRCRNFSFSGTNPKAVNCTNVKHVIWDEHLSLSVKDPAGDTFVEIRVLNASVDHGATEMRVLAAREGEPFKRFSERNRLSGVVASTSRSPCKRKPKPLVYHLRFDHKGVPGETGLAKVEGSGVNSGFEGVKVRIACLLIAPGELVTRADDVEAFLKRQADVARAPGVLKRPLSCLNSGASSASMLPMGKLLSLSHPRILDLTVARGIFRKYADSERCEDETQDARWILTIEMGQPSGPSENKEDSFNENPSPQGMLSKEGLFVMAQECFPGFQLPELDADATTLGQTTEQSLVKKSGSKQPPLSFPDFVSWLRNVPATALGTTGLFVSPRTALRHTEMCMDQSAEHSWELAAALKCAQEAPKCLIEGWSSTFLKSTDVAVALDRVRLGLGEASEEIAESTWRRHIRMLRRDVVTFGEALLELEDRCNPTKTASCAKRCRYSTVEYRATASRNSNAGGEEIRQAIKEPRSGEVHVEHSDEDSRIASEISVTGGVVNPLDSVLARYLGQDAAKLGEAAKHLKESLRCAGDTLCRNIETTWGKSVNQRNTHERTTFEADRSSTFDGRWWTGSSAAKDASDAHIHLYYQYGLVLQQIKRVTDLQAEIGGFQRRTAALQVQTGQKNNRNTGGWRTNSGYCKEGDYEIEVPRSALALVKRIRRAQEAAQSLPACEEIFSQAEEALPWLCEQNDDSVTHLETLDHDSSVGNNEITGRPREDGGSQSRQEFSDVQVLEEGGEPLCDMLRKPSLLEKVEKRLETIRVAFEKSAVDLSAAFPRTTAKRMIEIASGAREDTAMTTRMESAVAMCCPIDRYSSNIYPLDMLPPPSHFFAQFSTHFEPETAIVLFSPSDCFGFDAATAYTFPLQTG